MGPGPVKEEEEGQWSDYQRDFSESGGPTSQSSRPTGSCMKEVHVCSYDF